MVKFLTVSSSNMDFVLVFLMMLAFISFGKSDGLTKETTDQCFNKCPAGFHKVGDCPGHTNKLKCKKCEDQTYTALENSIEHCLRCASCSANEIEIKPCSATSDVQCGCKKGYYKAGGDNDRKCQSCRSCRRDPNCRSKCQTATTPPPTDSSTSPSPSKGAKETTTPTLSSGPVVPTRIAPPNTTSPGVTQAPPPPDSLLFWLVIVLVTLLLLFWLLLLLRSLHKYSVGCCARWTINKDMESPNGEPKFNERSDQGSSPTTLTLNISEETPMMALCQSEAVQESPTHISLLLRGGDHRAARPDEQADRWPAIVLYAIIREVPLRRWKEFLRLLSVADQELERVELEAGLGLGSMERQYQMLRLWSQRSSASLNDVFSALHYMDLSGCAQLLQESLDKLQWRPGPKQAFTACRSHTDHSLYGAAQDT